MILFCAQANYISIINSRQSSLNLFSKEIEYLGPFYGDTNGLPWITKLKSILFTINTKFPMSSMLTLNVFTDSKKGNSGGTRPDDH